MQYPAFPFLNRQARPDSILWYWLKLSSGFTSTTLSSKMKTREGRYSLCCSIKEAIASDDELFRDCQVLSKKKHLKISF
jgi:hypothetical protein